MPEKVTRSWNTRKIAAITAGALVVGLGATYTLATWNDSEWVWGGTGSTPGVGTSKFEVEQSVDGLSTWQNDAASPGGSLAFAANALALTPGTTTFAPVSLRTQAGSVGGDVTLQAAVENSAISGTSTALWSAVNVTVYTSPAAVAPICDGTLAGWAAVPGLISAPLATTATADQRLDAGASSSVAGDAQHYCFAINLPAGASDTLQGTTIAPIWRFDSISD